MAATAATRSRRSAAIRMLREDHRQVKEMFRRFENLDDDEQKGLLVRAACHALAIHAQLEEELFYPALRRADVESDLLDEAEVEHASARQLIAQLEQMQPGDEFFDARFKVLGEYVEHHIKEEEREIFPQASKAADTLRELEPLLIERRRQLRLERGLPESEEEAKAELDALIGRARSRRDGRAHGEAGRHA